MKNILKMICVTTLLFTSMIGLNANENNVLPSANNEQPLVEQLISDEDFAEVVEIEQLVNEEKLENLDQIIEDEEKLKINNDELNNNEDIEDIYEVIEVDQLASKEDNVEKDDEITLEVSGEQSTINEDFETTSVDVENILDVNELLTAITNSNSGDVLKLSTLFVSSDLVLNLDKDITIDGQQINWENGIIKVTGNGNLSIKNINMDGSTINGRLLTNNLSKGSLAIDNVKFINSIKGAIAITAESEVVTTLSNVLIKNNIAGHGPAISFSDNNQSNVTVLNSTIDGNSGNAPGYEAGAIAAKSYYGNLTINNTVLSNNINKAINTNVTGGGGGAMSLHFLRGNVVINESYFYGNQTNGDSSQAASTYDGGAIYVFDGRDGATFTINSTTFANNVAYDDGGAIMFQGTGNPGLTTTITDSTFFNNHAYGLTGGNVSGGAIQYFKNGGSSVMTNKVISSTFINNVAGSSSTTVNQSGGALSASGAGFLATASFTLDDNMFLANDVYASNGEINPSSVKKNISKNVSAADKKNNIINVDQSINTTENLSIFEDVLGKDGGHLSFNYSTITAGYEHIIIPTVPYKPTGLADNTCNSTNALPGFDQRGYLKGKSMGATQQTNVIYEANGGYFNISPQNEFTYNRYYVSNSDTEITKVYNIGYVGLRENLETEVSLVPTKDGYTFKGWSQSETSNVEVAFATVLHDLDDITLYAIWERNMEYYTITYNTLGGSTIIPETVPKIRCLLNRLIQHMGIIHLVDGIQIIHLLLNMILLH